jgi:hypothetical protein
MSKPTKVAWFFSAGGVGRSGPYPTQLEASAATMGRDGFPVAGAFVWPEEIDDPPNSPMREKIRASLKRGRAARDAVLFDARGRRT